jgi:hypothetical protein
MDDSLSLTDPCVLAIKDNIIKERMVLVMAGNHRRGILLCLFSRSALNNAPSDDRPSTSARCLALVEVIQNMMTGDN